MSRAQHGELGVEAPVSLAALAAAAVEARGDEIAAQRLDVRIGAGARTRAAARHCSRSSSPTSSTTRCGTTSRAAGCRSRRAPEGDVATLVVESSGPHLDARRVQQLTQPFPASWRRPHRLRVRARKTVQVTIGRLRRKPARTT